MDRHAASVDRDRALQFEREQELKYLADLSMRGQMTAEEAWR